MLRLLGCVVEPWPVTSLRVSEVVGVRIYAARRRSRFEPQSEDEQTDVGRDAEGRQD